MYFPLFLNISGAKFLIIGAGNVALSKTESVLEFSKNITVLSKEIAPDVKNIFLEKKIEFILSSYDKKYLQKFDIIIVATNDKNLNQQIALEAKSLNKMVNVVDDPENSSFIFGANFKKGNVITSISSSGVSPVLARILKNKLQNSLPQNLELISNFLEKNKKIIREKFINLQARRIFLQDVIDGIIGVELEAGNIKKAQNLLEEKLFKESDKKQSAVYFISAGPGDPELITLKAIKLLAKADIVLYDRLVAPEILNYARKDAIKVNVGKTKDLHRYKQEEINNLLRHYAKQGNVVVRLKGGDATIFARLSEEIDAIYDLNIPYQIIPGVTSASGAGASIGISLTSREANKSVRFLTIYQKDLIDDKYFKTLAESEDTLVLYMTSHNLGDVVNNLIKFGKNPKTPLAIIEQATTIYQKTFSTNLEDFHREFLGQKFVSPSIVIIGDVVAWHKKYKWREENFTGEFFNKITKAYKDEN